MVHLVQLWSESHVLLILYAKYSNALIGGVQMPHHFVLKPVSVNRFMNECRPDVLYCFDLSCCFSIFQLNILSLRGC